MRYREKKFWNHWFTLTLSLLSKQILENENFAEISRKISIISSEIKKLQTFSKMVPICSKKEVVSLN